MARMLAPDHACVETETDRRRYRGTVLDVTDSADVRDLKAAGYTLADAAGQPTKASGRRCRDCGFAGWFRVCGRCGGPCERN